MRTIVCKFGGSSTANAGQFGRILEIVRASPARRCIVLSAPGVDGAHGEKVTALLEACWQSRKDSEKLDRAVNRVADHFCQIASVLGLPSPDCLVRREILSAVGSSLPHTLSRGEYLCARLFSRYSGIPMIDAAEVIAFDGCGDPDFERTEENFRALALRGERMILPGFYGADTSGRVCVFPRNGSDITGALAAAGMGAALYENWTDVPGLMTADPAIVPEARLIPLVGYRQMRAMSRAGAKVLHPACLDPVAMSGIPTRLRDTANPDSFGTLIDEHCERIAPALTLSRVAAHPGTPAETFDRVSVFGLPSDRVTRAARICGALNIQETTLSVDVYVDPGAGERCLQTLHKALIEGE